MSNKFDENQPHSCEWGMGGIQFYEQNGNRYNARKELISAEPEVQESASPDADTPADMPDYAVMHWSALKKLVEAKGGEWIDKTAAIEFLSGN